MPLLAPVMAATLPRRPRSMACLLEVGDEDEGDEECCYSLISLISLIFIVFLTLSGVIGSWLTGAARASARALAIAGTAPMVPPSPMPLTPSGLWGAGDSRWTISMVGMSARPGT